MTKTASSSWNGWKVRCVVTDSSGNTAVSDTATITIAEGISITTQPASVTSQAGQNVTFSINATGTGLTYQWQYQGRTSTKWTNFANASGATMTKTASSSWNGWKVRCMVADSNGNMAVSDTATITIEEGISITTQPASVTPQAGQSVTFSITATGTGLSYQWQYQGRTSTKWTNFVNATGATMTKTVQDSWDGWKIRCVVIDDGGNIVYSDVATITIMGQANGWISDYEYVAQGNKIKLTKYKGDDTAIVVPGSVIVDETEYNTVEISAGLWRNAKSLTFEKGVVFPSDSSNLFESCWSLKSIDLSNVDTSNVTDMSNMFYDCDSLTNLDLSGFDTGNVADMSYMFYDCDNLTNLDLSNFNTGNVTDMNNMFGWCNSLTSLDLSGFETVYVRNMSYMFYACGDLTSLDLSEFDTFSVSDMSYMFSYCDSLTRLNISSFNFSNVYLTDCMFYECSDLMEINAPGAVVRAIALPGTYVGTNGVYYRYLPKRKGTPMLLLWAGSETGDFHIGSGSGNPYSGSGSGNPSTSEVPCITAGPEDVTAPEGTAVSFSIQAKGSGLTYQWQYQGATSTKWTNFSNATNPAITKTIQSGWDGWKVRCFVTDEDGDVAVSDTALITIGIPITITSQPASVSAQSGQSITFGVTATGKDLIYQWQYQGATSNKWIDFVNEEGDSMTMTVQGNWNGCKVRCFITNSSGYIVYSNAATITITGQVNGWLSDYNYEIQGNKIKLTGYNGDDTAIVVPGSVVVGGREYDTVEISAGLWKNAKSLTFESGVIFPDDSSNLFGYSQLLESIDLDNVDTSNVTDMQGMFYWCSSLRSLEVSCFDTGNVTNMENMFFRCENITSLDVSGLNTENVTNMHSMFQRCKNLTSLDVSGFDTKKVTDMRNMFCDCNSLRSLDVSSFDTGNVTDMQAIFSSCSALTSLDVSGFDTGNVTDMRGMFHNCSSLRDLDVSRFDTGNVTDMGVMFYVCRSLTSLDVSGFDTGNVITMDMMFCGCDGLTSLDVSGFDTRNVTNMGLMFRNCSKLTSLDVSGFDTRNVTHMGSMFNGCNGLTSLDVSGFDTEQVEYMYNMFEGCNSLKSLDVREFDTGNVTRMNEMFSDCSSLISLDISSFDFSNVNVSTNMLYNCSALKEINSPGALNRVITLPGTYVGTDGVYYKYLPKRKETAMFLIWDSSESGDFSIDNEFGNQDSSELPVINAGPVDVTGPVGTAVNFSIEAEGCGLTYQWQYQEASSMKWINFSNATDSAITKTIQSGWNGWKVRCFVTDADGDVAVSDIAIITVTVPSAITSLSVPVTLPERQYMRNKAC